MSEQQPSLSPLQNETRNELMGLSLRDMFYKYIRFLPVFVFSVAISLIGAYLYLRYATPIYNTTGTLVIKADQQGGKGDKFDDLFQGERGQSIHSEIEVLKSKGLMNRVVEKQDLQFTYYVKGKIRTINIYRESPFVLKADSLFNAASPFAIKLKFIDNNQFRVNSAPETVRFEQQFQNQFGIFRLIRNPNGSISTDYQVDYKPTASAAAFYAGALLVAPKTTGTGIINIGLQGTHPQLIADIVNQLMDEYGDYTRELKNRTSDQKIEFIDARMAKLGKELDSVQNQLLRYMQDNNIIDVDMQKGAYFDNLSESDKAINEELRNINTAEFIAVYLKDKRNVYGTVVVPSSLGLNDATLNGLVGNYNALQIKRQEMLDGNIPEKNPAVVELTGQIEKLRVSLLENLSNIRNSYNKTITSLRNNSGQAEGQLKMLPYKTKGYLEIKRQVDNKQTLYNVLLEEREKTAISRAANISNSQIIEKAFVSTIPVKPNRRSIQLMAILLGLALPALFIFAGEILNDKVTTRADVEKITAAPILGEIGHSYADNTLIVTKTTRSMVAEQFRIIRSNLQYVVGKKERFTLLVTSSYSGEGKSFVSTNVAAVMALAGKKTVILEFDIRKPKVLSGLKMERGPGITNFLIGKTNDLATLIRPVPQQENLFVIGCGPVPPNPAELLLDDRINDLFEWLKKEFDVVIIDTAPVGMVSDAQTLSRFADATLYLIRQGHTFKKQITLIDEFYREQRLPKVSVVINDVKLKAGYGYYGYGRYGYGYGYGYGSYYEEETPPQNFIERALSALDFRKWFRKKRK